MQQSSAKEFKIQCFRLLTLPMLFTEEEKFCFVYKIYRLSKRREEFYRQRMRMDEDISMYNWALAAMTSSNEAVRNTADFQSKQVPGWDATWRIGPFLRNAIEHIGTVDTTEVEVLNELENMYPQILSKLHFELWNKLLDEKKENDEKDEKDEKDYGYVIHHFQKKPGAFAFIMGLGGDVAY
ncbi:hypothetical protein Tsubulata_048241 [Turnera subulata]|uniref:Uncharacterized protein n=1 Tax=Turnera subulata TaxID=218843 RepID=A0A9Q0J5M4_9ROSI|nr:hypothetical protein Tsubulata_048241 [Turnera subulata]